ncbi:MAG TPA: FAD-dependent oxidoreductase, partial [Polyangiales bacterium]
MSTVSLDPIATENSIRARLNGRYDETFLLLSAAEIARLCHFGAARRYKKGEALSETGKPAPGMAIVLSGHVSVTTRDGIGRVWPVVDLGPGQFLGELSALSDNAEALVDAHAENEVEVVLVPPAGLRSILVAEAELGERLMRALVLRRVGLIRMDGGGPLLIGSSNSSDMLRLENFLTRNGHPHHRLDPATDSAAAEILARYPAPVDRPIVICPNGVMLKNPSELELARELGLISDVATRREYDVVVVGCGPAGLATAVYAASEGLSVLVLDGRAFGGQAGASARIENYFGFPTGISGQALTARAYAQARKFGAEISIPVEVKSLDCSRCRSGSFELLIDDDKRVRARSIVIASGARYRRPVIENLAMFEGRGVYYWASPLEAALCAGHEIILVGGGNSAGQAAVFLSKSVSKVRMMVRSDGLAASMSRYLIDRIAATPNIELMTETALSALEGGSDGLERVRFRTRSEAELSAPIRSVFLFIGADPATGWLSGCG